jgi:hypothetical protein
MTRTVTDSEKPNTEILLSDEELLTEFSNYLQTKYLFETYHDTECLYINLKTGRLVIPFSDLIEFIDNNCAQYESLNFTAFDLIDAYIMTMLTNTLDSLTNSEFKNVFETLLQ